jgi:hypothetical protein
MHRWVRWYKVQTTSKKVFHGVPYASPVLSVTMKESDEVERETALFHPVDPPNARLHDSVLHFLPGGISTGN